MSCGGFIKGKIGQTVSFDIDAVGLVSLTGRVLTGDGSGGVITRETLTRQQLSQGWELQEGLLYDVILMPVPSHADIQVRVSLAGEVADNDFCPGGSELRGPWTVWGGA